MARGIPLVIIGSIERIHLGAGANDCLGFQGAEALRHRWNWNKWGRNKSPHNDRVWPSIKIKTVKRTRYQKIFITMRTTSAQSPRFHQEGMSQMPKRLRATLIIVSDSWALLAHGISDSFILVLI